MSARNGTEILKDGKDGRWEGRRRKERREVEGGGGGGGDQGRSEEWRLS